MSGPWRERLRSPPGSVGERARDLDAVAVAQRRDGHLGKRVQDGTLVSLASGAGPVRLIRVCRVQSTSRSARSSASATTSRTGASASSTAGPPANCTYLHVSVDADTMTRTRWLSCSSVAASALATSRHVVGTPGSMRACPFRSQGAADASRVVANCSSASAGSTDRTYSWISDRSKPNCRNPTSSERRSRVKSCTMCPKPGQTRTGSLATLARARAQGGRTSPECSSHGTGFRILVLATSSSGLLANQTDRSRDLERSGWNPMTPTYGNGGGADARKLAPRVTRSVRSSRPPSHGSPVARCRRRCTRSRSPGHRRSASIRLSTSGRSSLP